MHMLPYILQSLIYYHLVLTLIHACHIIQIDSGLLLRLFLNHSVNIESYQARHFLLLVLEYKVVWIVTRSHEIYQS